MEIFTVVAILLGLTALFGFLNERWLRLQPTIGLMLLALLFTVAVGGLKAAGIVPDLVWYKALIRELDLSEVLLNGVLCFMLFAGSVGVDIRSLRAQQWTVLSLAIGATVLACLLVGGMLSATLAWLGIALALPYALVFGALISPTDPIAALAILKSAELPKPLETILNGESLFNDGVAVVLFTMALTIAQGSAETASDGALLFLREVLGGVGLGLLVSAVMHAMLMRTKDYGNQVIITLSAVALGYSVALHVDVSGPIAMVVAGLAIGNVTAHRIAPEHLAPLATFWRGIDEVLNALLFVMIGLYITLIHDLSWAPLVIVVPVAIVVCLAARALSVYVPIAILGVSRRLQADTRGLTKLLTWAGLRGGLALALAISLPESAEKPLILNMTFGVVAFSILVQGTTIGKFFKPAYLRGLMRSG